MAIGVLQMILQNTLKDASLAENSGENVFLKCYLLCLVNFFCT